MKTNGDVFFSTCCAETNLVSSVPCTHSVTRTNRCANSNSNLPYHVQLKSVADDTLHAGVLPDNRTLMPRKQTNFWNFTTGATDRMEQVQLGRPLCPEHMSTFVSPSRGVTNSILCWKVLGRVCVCVEHACKFISSVCVWGGVVWVNLGCTLSRLGSGKDKRNVWGSPQVRSEHDCIMIRWCGVPFAAREMHGGNPLQSRSSRRNTMSCLLFSFSGTTISSGNVSPRQLTDCKRRENGDFRQPVWLQTVKQAHLNEFQNDLPTFGAWDVKRRPLKTECLWRILTSD